MEEIILIALAVTLAWAFLLCGIATARFRNWFRKLKGYSFKQHLTLLSVLKFYIIGLLPIAIVVFAGTQIFGVDGFLNLISGVLG